MNKIEQTILGFVNSVYLINNISGCFICGSYAAGNYTSESDIDILFLCEGSDFIMTLEEYQGVLFDKLIVDSQLLKDVIMSNCQLANILSLSFGLVNYVLLDSRQLSEITNIAKKNIIDRNLVYIKDITKPKKTADYIPIYIEKKNEKYHLIKNNEILC